MGNKLCSVNDAVSKAWTAPQMYMNENQALRAFKDAVNTEGSPFNQHPEDYALHCVGEFDEHTGETIGHAPQLIVSAVNVHQPKMDFHNAPA